MGGMGVKTITQLTQTTLGSKRFINAKDEPDSLQDMKELLLAVVIATSMVGARGQDLVATVKQEAQKCAKAVLASDYGSIVLYTHPRIVKAMGGKEAMIEILKNGMS